MPRTQTALDLLEIGTPSAPASGRNLLYFKSDGNLYKEDSSGVETNLGVGFGNVNVKVANYTLVQGDNGTVIGFSGTTLTATLLASPPAEPWFAVIVNFGTSPLTVSPNGNQLNGVVANITLQQFETAFVWSGATSYIAMSGIKILTSSTATNLTGLLTGSGSVLGSVAAPAGTVVGTTDTQTISAKRVTKRVVTVTQSATPTINTDNTDVASITALAQAITSVTTNLTGTPNDGDSLIVRITDNGTARAITWGAKFEASTVALPTTTVISTELITGFLWNTATSKWRCVAVA